MTGIRKRGEAIRKFIMDNVSQHGGEIAMRTAEQFDISRQAANKHLSRLVNEGVLNFAGNTRSRVYSLASGQDWEGVVAVESSEGEDKIWRSMVAPRISPLPDNVMDIWMYAFSEMYNNALEHSQASSIRVSLSRSPSETQISISDDGVGIFKKIMKAFDLEDERHAVLELAKGKLTTDPKEHSGEGIFFTSRALDSFSILSGETYFSHEIKSEEDWLMERTTQLPGTHVFMSLENHTSRTIKQTFDKYTTGDDYGFNKTVVPVRMAQYGNEFLVSRSQAKRVLARVDRFRTVFFDFEGVDSIGQAFADEIFRVFASKHPEMTLIDIQANEEVGQMVRRAVGRKREEGQ